MKLQTLCKLTTVFIFLSATETYAGGVAGGGGPPAIIDLQTLLSGPALATVFELDNASLAVGVAGELTPEISLNRNVVQGFERLEDETTIQAVNLSGDRRSYQVMRDGSADTILLIEGPSYTPEFTHERMHHLSVGSGE